MQWQVLLLVMLNAWVHISECHSLSFFYCELKFLSVVMTQNVVVVTELFSCIFFSLS